MSDMLSDKFSGLPNATTQYALARDACEGGSDPTELLGGSSPKKWGRSRPIWCFFLCHFSHSRVVYFLVFPKLKCITAQHRVLPASKLSVAPRATSCSLGTCSIAKVTARVTHMVIWVFHAHFTFPHCKNRSRVFEIVMPHISKRPRK